MWFLINTTSFIACYIQDFFLTLILSIFTMICLGFPLCLYYLEFKFSTCAHYGFFSEFGTYSAISSFNIYFLLLWHSDYIYSGVFNYVTHLSRVCQFFSIHFFLPILWLAWYLTSFILDNSSASSVYNSDPLVNFYFHYYDF